MRSARTKLSLSRGFRSDSIDERLARVPTVRNTKIAARSREVSTCGMMISQNRRARKAEGFNLTFEI
jgi:hypothetical protein